MGGRGLERTRPAALSAAALGGNRGTGQEGRRSGARGPGIQGWGAGSGRATGGRAASWEDQGSECAAAALTRNGKLSFVTNWTSGMTFG